MRVLTFNQIVTLIIILNKPWAYINSVLNLKYYKTVGGARGAIQNKEVPT